MAQPVDTRRSATPDAQRSQNSSSSRSSRTQTSPNCQHLQGDSKTWSPNSSLKLRKNHEHDDHGNHHHKKSVLMKVKEKAKKLKKSLSGKKRRDDNELHSPLYSTPPAGARIEDDEKDEPEFFDSPLYELEVAPGTDKPAAKEHPRETIFDQKEDRSGTNTGLQSVASDRLLESTDSKLSGLSDGTETEPLDANKPEPISEGTSSLQWDKGVSVKEYLMHKFEPGEDERVLSQVITQTICPKREKVREAMSSLLRSEEPAQSANPELDITPAASGLSQNLAGGSSGEPSDPSHRLESSLSNASSLSLMSSSTAASWQTQDLSNMKPNHGSSHSNSNPNPSLSTSHVHTSASTSSHEVAKDENRHRVPQAN